MSLCGKGKKREESLSVREKLFALLLWSVSLCGKGKKSEESLSVREKLMVGGAVDSYGIRRGGVFAWRPWLVFWPKVNEEANFDWFSHFPEHWSSPLRGWEKHFGGIKGR